MSAHVAQNLVYLVKIDFQIPCVKQLHGYIFKLACIFRAAFAPPSEQCKWV